MNTFYKIFNNTVYTLFALIAIIGIPLVHMAIYWKILLVLAFSYGLYFLYSSAKNNPKNSFIYNCMIIPGCFLINSIWMFLGWAIFAGLTADFITKRGFFEKKEIEE